MAEGYARGQLTIKYVNFKKFKEIFEMKKSGKYDSETLYEMTMNIRDGMNSQLDFNSPEVQA
jgi:hypothetical protein